MTEFMVNMHSNQTPYMMQGNKMMMGNMMGDNGMQMMMKKDSMMKFHAWNDKLIQK
jgi:hypothetical protein